MKTKNVRKNIHSKAKVISLTEWKSAHPDHVATPIEENQGYLNRISERAGKRVSNTAQIKKEHNDRVLIEFGIRKEG